MFGISSNNSTKTIGALDHVGVLDNERVLHSTLSVLRNIGGLRARQCPHEVYTLRDDSVNFKES